MKGHAQSSIEERIRSFEELRQEAQGRLPKGPFEFSESLEFDDVVTASDKGPVAAFRRAVRRDARYSSAGGVFLRRHGLSQSLRHIYDGGRQLVDGGAE